MNTRNEPGMAFARGLRTGIVGSIAVGLLLLLVATQGQSQPLQEAVAAKPVKEDGYRDGYFPGQFPTPTSPDKTEAPTF